MKRYLAFFGAIYYPSTGMGDFIGDFDNLGDAFNAINEACVKELKDSQYDDVNELMQFRWASIYDCELRKEITEEVLLKQTIREYCQKIFNQ